MLGLVFFLSFTNSVQMFCFYGFLGKFFFGDLRADVYAGSFAQAFVRRFLSRCLMQHLGVLK